MFALNIPSTFGDTIDCRINGKAKRVTWRDEHTLVIEADPYSTAPVDTAKFRRQLVGLRSPRQPAGRPLRGKRNFEAHKRGCRIQKSPDSQSDLINNTRLLSKPVRMKMSALVHQAPVSYCLLVLIRFGKTPC